MVRQAYTRRLTKRLQSCGDIETRLVNWFEEVRKKKQYCRVDLDLRKCVSTQRNQSVDGLAQKRYRTSRLRHARAYDLWRHKETHQTQYSLELANLLERTLSDKLNARVSDINIICRKLAYKYPSINLIIKIKLNRIRIGHTRRTHGFLMERGEPSICTSRGTDLSINGRV